MLGDRIFRRRGSPNRQVEQFPAIFGLQKNNFAQSKQRVKTRPSRASSISSWGLLNGSVGSLGSEQAQLLPTKSKLKKQQEMRNR